jgi:hypothetical protein
LVSGANRRRRRVLGLAALALLAAACSEIDDPVVSEIGTTRVLAVDSDLAPQSVTEPEGQIQAAVWEISSAALSYEGLEEPLELTIDSNCRVVDTVYELPILQGRCLEGMIIDSNVEPERPVAYTPLAFEMQVRRARPIALPPAADYDADGVLNAEDNCPLVFNPDQRDDDLNDIGDACQVDLSGFGPLLDSDADGVADALDNCVWISNPDQENTEGLGEEGINDGIGDACVEQRAQVLLAGNQNISISSEVIGLLQPRFGLTSVTADFVSSSSLSGCIWEDAPGVGSCNLNPSSVLYCVSFSLNEAGLLGCR